ncbi:AAA family ATPase [Ursidibacter sp. B-7004-1]
MIIQFVAENYRSIKTEQTLSLVRSSSTEMPDNFFDSTAPNTPTLLKSAVIYGANASGKSNTIKALASMLSIIRNSSKKDEDDPIDTEVFLFDSVVRNQPSMYDISVVLTLPNDDGDLQPMRVDYGFVADKTMVYEEWLSVYPKGRERNWFYREYSSEKKEYEWKISDYLKGEKESWKNQTRKDQLFLATAVQLNSEQLQPIYRFFTKDIIMVFTDRIPNELSKNICKSSTKEKELVVSLMKSAGIKINDIVFKKPNITAKFPSEIPDLMKEKIIKDIEAQNETFFIYFDELNQPQEINLRDESDGTQKLFEFAGLILAVLKNGNILVIDELNKSLHPDLVRFLVKIFNSSLNKNNAQLIFTTHETSVLRKDLLRRDQIWFCEKEKDRSTILYPLTDFNPHKNREDIEEYYLNGRYGAKPLFNEFILPNDFWEDK